MIMSVTTIYKSHTITKQQFEQALAAKQEAESQVRILQQQEKASAHQNLL
jgi:membrane fusion protein (multidrug efflux system)